ncbi:MAG: AbrB family transcriptional regulator [Firmicutes bacterium]|nr:AbrB family transcriptional regulator [Bacillota bacterium]MDD4708349.1 AbrB family transcriptional regulator [Bacillota bacterium]
MENLTFNLPMTLVLIISLGFLGYRLFKFMHIPGGAITGSLLIVAVFSSLGLGWADIPSYYNTSFQVVLGIIMGCKFSKETASSIKKLVIPGLFVSAWMIGLSLAMGVLLTKVTGMDLGTALYGTTPGGLSEMGILAMANNMNVPVVTLFQFVRVIAVYLSVPVIALKYYHREKKWTTDETAATMDKSKDGEKQKKNVWCILASIAAGAAGGFAAKAAGVPVGGMLGAMAVVGILRILGVPLAEPPKWLLIMGQIGLGGCLGTTFTPEVLSTLLGLIVPTIVFSAVIVLNGIITGFLVHSIFGWDLITSLLASAAAGVTQMSAIALDMDADAVTVGLLQALRFALIMLLMPTLINHIIV